VQVFVPPGKPMDEPEPEFSWEDFWPARFVWLVLTLVVGWPLYLCINATGRPYNHWPVNHFDPYSPIFRYGLGSASASNGCCVACFQ